MLGFESSNFSAPGSAGITSSEHAVAPPGVRRFFLGLLVRHTEACLLSPQLIRSRRVNVLMGKSDISMLAKYDVLCKLVPSGCRVDVIEESRGRVVKNVTRLPPKQRGMRPWSQKGVGGGITARRAGAGITKLRAGGACVWEGGRVGTVVDADSRGRYSSQPSACAGPLLLIALPNLNACVCDMPGMAQSWAGVSTGLVRRDC